jgi:hypothetical protein
MVSYKYFRFFGRHVDFRVLVANLENHENQVVAVGFFWQATSTWIYNCSLYFPQV